MQKSKSECRTCSLRRIKLGLKRSLIQQYPTTQRHLQANADIVHRPQFENAVCKLQGGFTLAELNEQERHAVEVFFPIEAAIQPLQHSQVHGGGIAAALAAAQATVQLNEKRLKTFAKKSLNHCLPTSCIVERLVSRAKLIMTPNRRSMDPSTLENILLLKFNPDLYRATDIFELKQNRSTNTTNTPNQRLESPALSPLDSIQSFESASSASSSSNSSSSSSSSSSMFSTLLIAFGRGTTVTSSSRGGGRGRGNGGRTKR